MCKINRYIIQYKCSKMKNDLTFQSCAMRVRPI